MVCQHHFIAESAAEYSSNACDSKPLRASRSKVLHNKIGWGDKHVKHEVVIRIAKAFPKYNFKSHIQQKDGIFTQIQSEQRKKP